MMQEIFEKAGIKLIPPDTDSLRRDILRDLDKLRRYGIDCENWTIIKKLEYLCDVYENAFCIAMMQPKFSSVREYYYKWRYVSELLSRVKKKGVE
jgi:hypothetical protein